MTERQKEMLKNRALMEFLDDYPEMEDIKKYGLIGNILFSRSDIKEIDFSHWCLLVMLYNESAIIYVPKERFKIKEENKDV